MGLIFIGGTKCGMGATELPNYRFRYRGSDGRWKALYFQDIATTNNARSFAIRKGLAVTPVESISPLLKGEVDPEASAWFERMKMPKVEPKRRRRLRPLVKE